MSSYRNYSTPKPIPVVLQDSFPASGGDPVSANATFDLNVSYTLSSGRFKDSQVFVDVVNLADKDPAFYNNLNGVDSFSGYVLGRVITGGLRVKVQGQVAQVAQVAKVAQVSGTIFLHGQMIERALTARGYHCR